MHVHPGAEELGRVYHPHLAIHAAPTGFAAALEGLQPPNEISWRAQTKTAHDDYLAWTENATPQPGGVNLGEIVVWLRQNLPEDAFITTGAGNFSAWVHRFYRFRKFATHIGPTSGSMGYGVPSALGIKRAFPERTVVCFSGDGDFLMNGQEFATAVQYDLPFIIVIADNGTYGTIRMHQEREYPTRVVGTELQESGLRGLCQGVRRLRRHGGEDRGFRRRVPGRGKIRQARDHPPQGRHQRLDAGTDARRHPRQGAGRAEGVEQQVYLNPASSRSHPAKMPQLRRRVHVKNRLEIRERMRSCTDIALRTCCLTGVGSRRERSPAFCLTSGSATMRATSLCSRSMIGFGVPAGATNPIKSSGFLAGNAGLCRGRNVGEVRRALGAGDRERAQLALLDQRRGRRQRDESDRRVAAERRGDQRGGALERHADHVDLQSEL